MKRILCPTDFSETSKNACLYAAGMASTLDAELVLLHIMHVPAVDANAAVAAPADLMESMEQTSRSQLRELEESIAEEIEVKVTSETCFGLAAEAINEKEADLNVDLVVMGTNGASGGFEKMLGTVSYAVARNSERPVVVVPPDSTYDGFEVVALADDHKENLDRIREALVPICDENYVLHNVSIDETGEKYLYREEVVDESTHHKEVCVWSESVLSGLSKYVNIHSVDLVAVKRHKRSFFENLFHKSITKTLLNEGFTPIIIFNH
jgi:nucleotide-binding universal stress UspA family protein